MQNFDDDEIERIFIDNDENPFTSVDSDMIKAVNSTEEYKKLRKLIFTITAVAALLTFVRGISLVRFLSDFMATFFIIFAGLKFVNIEQFVTGFRSFNIIASKVRPCGYVYPFVEIMLGFWYLLSDAPQKLNIIAATLNGAILVATFLSYSRDKEARSFATNKYLRLPLLSVMILENAALLIFALMNLLLKL